MKKISILISSTVLVACGGNSDQSVDTGQLVQSNSVQSLAIDAGENIFVDERQNVNLAGAILQSEGETIVSWFQISGSEVNLRDEDRLSASFRAPETSEDETLVLRLSVTDGNSTVTDDLTVFVSNRSNSSQGIDDNISDRRDNAESDRDNDRPIIDSREVRTYDGSNNNLSNELWGASFTQLARWAAPDYGDLISSLAGGSRPSARVVSNNLVAQAEGVSIPNTFGTTDYLWQWGQFIDHDIGITDGAEESADIEVPAGDVFFDPSSSGEQVILFNRAFFDHDTGTAVTNPRQQENEITAWIDGSMVYGSDEARALALREGNDSPYLETSRGNLLPFNSSGQTNANAFGVANDELFLAGDVRVNEQLGLAVMHTLWVREHNRIAEILEDDFPGSSAEDIFQAARRLVVAKIQIITYEEYLPALIGENAISAYTGYDDEVNPGMFNEFSVAAYRYGHSLVNETLLRVDEEGETIDEGNLALRDVFFSAPALLTREDSLDPILRGLASQLSQKLDTRINNDLRNFLFGQPGQGGFDLASLNIQRGRDHGIPSYNQMREVFGLSRKTSFAEISSDPEIQTALANTYASIDDIDLWAGGLAEDPLLAQGSQLGELFRAMHIRQFEAFRDGDRFWYENDLTDDELDRVEGTTLAEVIRANTDIRNELQDDVFYLR